MLYNIVEHVLFLTNFQLKENFTNESVLRLVLLPKTGKY